MLVFFSELFSEILIITRSSSCTLNCLETRVLGNCSSRLQRSRGFGEWHSKAEWWHGLKNEAGPWESCGLQPSSYNWGREEKFLSLLLTHVPGQPDVGLGGLFSAAVKRAHTCAEQCQWDFLSSSWGWVGGVGEQDSPTRWKDLAVAERATGAIPSPWIWVVSLQSDV